jgi:hypothetical protein
MVIGSLDEVTEQPLTWPDGRERAAHRRDGNFRVTMAQALKHLDEELRIGRITRYVLSMAARHRFASPDPGAALWWYQPPKTNSGKLWTPSAKDLRVLACDQFKLIEHNVRAIGLTLEALRAVERYGAYSFEEATQGARLALPDYSNGGVPWWEVLEVQRSWPIDAIEALAKTKLKSAHPDAGGDTEHFAALNNALAAARKEKGKSA